MSSFIDKFNELVEKKNSLLCVGLDVAKEKLPELILSENEPLFEFNKCIIDATLDFTLAYKLNSAFYEAYGIDGWRTMFQTVEYISNDAIVIADAKRGDIGNTSQKYAQAFLNELNFDAITVNPYMGYDSVEPFLHREDKGVFFLCLTSNPGAQDFQYFGDDKPLYRKVAEKVNQWNKKGNCGLVVGATRPEELSDLRSLAPQLIFLIPGLGFQGGDVMLSVLNGTDDSGSMALFNSSRGIIYKSSNSDFAEAARKASKELSQQINQVRFSKKRRSP